MLENRPYNMEMARKLSKPRPKQGAHLAALRRSAGMSQAELANAIGETQQNVAYWEQSSRPPRADVLPALSKALGVTIRALIEGEGAGKSQARRPANKVQAAFDEVASLPRRQQQKILDVVNALLEQHRRDASTS